MASKTPGPGTAPGQNRAWPHDLMQRLRAIAESVVVHRDGTVTLKVHAASPPLRARVKYWAPELQMITEVHNDPRACTLARYRVTLG